MATHGTLTKAGKVRKQTPKVAKKTGGKKPVTGRAKVIKRYHKRIFTMKQLGQKKFNPQEKE
jgi:ribosomal protein S30